MQRNDTQRMEEYMTLFFAHQRPLYFYILSLVPRLHDADDILQDTALLLWNKFDEYESGTDFYAWACQVAHYRILNFRREKHHATGQLDADVLERLASESIETNREHESQLAALSTCLEKLSPPDRQLIHERYNLGASLSDLSGRLGRTENALCKTLGRIRQALLKCIRRTLALGAKGGDAP